MCLVLAGGIVGINVFLVLLIGIVIRMQLIMLALEDYVGAYGFADTYGHSGASGMFETCMVAILVAAMCALIREYGGFEALIRNY